MERCVRHLASAGIRALHRFLPLFLANAPFKFVSLKSRSFWFHLMERENVLHSSTIYLVKATIISHLMTGTLPSTFDLLTPSFHTASSMIPKKTTNQRGYSPAYCSPEASHSIENQMQVLTPLSRLVWSDPTWCLLHSLGPYSSLTCSLPSGHKGFLSIPQKYMTPSSFRPCHLLLPLPPGLPLEGSSSSQHQLRCHLPEAFPGHVR